MSDEAAAKFASIAGEPRAINAQFETLYRELHTLAHRQLLRASPSRTINTTSLVHEAYVRLAKAGPVDVVDGRHFLAYAANAMRSVVVDMIRARRAEKRGSGSEPLTITTDVIGALPTTDDEVVRVHEALLELNTIDATLVQIVEMRYFAGLSEEEIADAMQISSRTVRRHWNKARIFLRENLSSD